MRIHIVVCYKCVPIISGRNCVSDAYSQVFDSSLVHIFYVKIKESLLEIK